MESRKIESKTKGRLLYLLHILEHFTDEEHPLSTNQLIDMLEKTYNIPTHRTTISKDVETLCEYGYDIVTIASTQNKYYMGDRVFEIPEITLLIDAINSSKFITKKKCKNLTTKLLGFASISQAQAIKHNLLSQESKSDNEQIYYIIDVIDDAISKSKKISFTYFEYSPDKKKVLKNDGKPYIFSPYAKKWNGEFYYMIGYSEKHKKVCTFRIDRINEVPTKLDTDAVPVPDDFDAEKYSTSVFSMYDGEKHTVELKCHNELMKTVIDRFGEDVSTVKIDDEYFKATVNVAVSPQFFGWLLGFDGKMSILSPGSVKDMYKDTLMRMLDIQNS